ncbi:hypothetical protein SUGI_0525040 [Cryptomeria japonica]|uniref:protein ARABIDILLO 2-like n=1 Tax=Cryptomeria japonica TaxID=3369 RepID=UPI002408E341|nr:protein ARABIDILLO 2-like [Cryptomeria japonica]XP_059077507.1 protein ARABIDILLO 2-like [Cryptomeria japonica]XP_059077508.1 protein ARABIDILLO 2-like [Cryptomeria japonica]XP_059077509.1 protein ARABIDILLO 2-like [Cryptomeria japonica]XP_059077510.1 protein ARABIDILLO 2-like [Cryptomeria japonica]XP_059077511.1 protein ARABIDILLO 2-like [Cryptomeria japonica]XP_059077512.1 protein ARABIDILLO 2-like [Cryptomeria japonica]XP_059077513.1 protein ARABIDILLO 2-like [Cryptomeria japonica]XP_
MREMSEPHSEDKITFKDNCWQESLHLLSIVIAEIVLVKSFRGKWNIIKNKLQLLIEEFTHIANLPDSVLTPTYTEVLKAILNTLNETRDLIKMCVDVELCIGKLQLQSNLDCLAIKLNQHLQDCKSVMKSEIMRESAICCTSRELLGLIEFGNIESKQRALDSLLSLMQQDEKYVYIVAGHNSAPVISHLLNSELTEIQEKAAAAVCRLAQADSFEHLLVREGILPRLVRLLKTGESVVIEKASLVLQALSFTPEIARSLGTICGVLALVDVCRYGTPAAQTAAAGTLTNLASVEDLRQHFLQGNAIPALIRLTTSGTTLARQHAADCLQNLVSTDDNLSSFIAKGGGIHALMFFWDGDSTPRAQEIAIGALKNILSCRANSDLLIASGFIPRLVSALNCVEIPTLKQVAAVAIYELATSMESRKALGEAGCIPPLVKMIEAENSSEVEQEAAAQALSVLLFFDGNRRIFKREVNGILGTVQLLNASSLNADKKYPISILLSVSDNAKCKREIVEAGACVYLKELAEMKVSGAKELLERLERDKFWNKFSRVLNCRSRF